MRLLLALIIIPFHLSAQKAENPYADLGDYIYASLRLYNCSCYWQGATLKPETVRKNHVRAITLPCDSQSCCWKEIWFDTLGRVSGYHKEDDVYFYYDNGLARKGINRVSCLLRHVDPFELPNGVYDSTIFTYDTFGNLTKEIEYRFARGYLPLGPASVVSYEYRKEKGHMAVVSTLICDFRYYSFPNLSEIPNVKPQMHTSVITYSLNLHSRKLSIQYGSSLDPVVFILRKPHKDPYSDTLHDFEEDFAVVDTIPNRRFYSMQSDAVPYHLYRDEEGRLVSVSRDYGKYQEGWSFEYDQNGLPVSLAYYWTDPDGGQTVERQKYIYQYY